MAVKPLKIGELLAARPIVQGGMGVGVSLSGLAGAVAACGGVGVISAAHPGYLEPDFYDNCLAANLRALSRHIEQAKAKAKAGIVGVNVMVAMKHYDELVKACVKHGADIIFSGAGLPVSLPALAAGSKIKIAPIVSSVKAAAVLLKMWDKKYGVTADAVVVEGPKAGGHLGFKLEELEAKSNFDDELKGVLSYVKTVEEKFQKSIPVIFGGGVFSKDDVNKYLSMGCGAVQLATRFVATNECDAHDNFKQAYLNAKPADAVMIKSPVGLPGRALLNDFVRRTREESEKVKKCMGCLSACDPKTTPYCITNALIASVRGDVDNGLVFCGSEVGRVTQTVPVAALMNELTE